MSYHRRDPAGLLLRQPGRKYACVRIHRFALGKLFKAAVRQHTPAKLGGHHFGRKLLRYRVFLLYHHIVALHRVPHGCAHVKMIFPPLQDIGRFRHLAQIVIGRHIIYIEPQHHRLGLPGLQQPRLLKGRQLSGGFSQPALRRAVVDLHHLFSRPLSEVAHIHHHPQMMPPLFHLGHGKRELRVGQSEAEGIVHLLRRSGNGLKIAVSHIDILGIVHIVIRLVEIVSGGVVLQPPGKGIRQLAAGVFLPDEQLRRR